MLSNLKKIDMPLLIFSVLLFALGLVMVFSASNVTLFMRYLASPYKYAIKHGGVLLVGIVSFFAIILFKTKRYNTISWILLFVSIGLLIYTLFFGYIVNDARSWIRIKNFNFQPSEVYKIVAIMWTACFYEKNRNYLDKYWVCLLPIVVIMLGCILIYKQPDLGTTIVIALLMLFIFILTPMKKIVKNRIMLVGVILALVGTIVFLTFGSSLISERQMKRLTNFTNPCSEEKFYTDGNQVCNAYIAVNNGGLSGKGLGNSTQKYLYLPEAHTDFIFAIVIEELGLIAAIVVLIMFMIVLYRVIVIGKRSPVFRNKIICFGVSFYIFLHIVVNLLGIFGVMPMTGVPLPFLSYGGTFTLMTIVSLSLVQRIAIENKIIEEKRNQ